MVFGRDYSGVSDTPIATGAQDEITLGLSNQTGVEVLAGPQASEAQSGIVQFDDSVSLSNRVSNDQSLVVFSEASGDNREEEIQAALERAGQIRGC